MDCGEVVSASNKLRVTSECLNSPCSGSVYEWLLKKNYDNNTWIDIPILPNMTSTAVNATNMIIKKNSLQSDSKYSLMVFVKPLQGTEGFAELQFETAGEPHSGYCSPSVSEGVSLETEFTFKCFEWQDKNTPLTYEFRLGDAPISSGISSKSVSTVLPAGAPEDDYKLQININIKNVVGVATLYTSLVKVIKHFLQVAEEPCSSINFLSIPKQQFVRICYLRRFQMGKIGCMTTITFFLISLNFDLRECTPHNVKNFAKLNISRYIFETFQEKNVLEGLIEARYRVSLFTITFVVMVQLFHNETYLQGLEKRRKEIEAQIN